MILFNLILILLVGGLLAWASESLHRALPAWIAAGVMVAVWYPLAPLFFQLDKLDQGIWLVNENLPWIPRFNITAHLAIDGLSFLLLILTLTMGMIAVLSAWKEIRQRCGFFYFNLLWSLAGVVGVFCALDLFLFFVFWEIMLVPMFLLIIIWGHENRRYAGMKFFIYTQAGGLLMLLSILALVLIHYQQSGQLSFDYLDLLQHQLSSSAQWWVMWGFLIAFAVKLPSLPFHGWLPDAHTQAPTAASVILAAVLLKTGAYGILRFIIPLFPDAVTVVAPYMIWLAAASIVYGGLMAFAQQDLKRLVAYSSVSHMGFVLLGAFALNSQAWQGAVMQMLAHGISTAALFALVGAIQTRYHTRDLHKLGGLWQILPRLSAVGLFFVAASMGLPGLGNFVAEFLVLLGGFQALPWGTALAASGLILAAIYSLRIAQQTFFGRRQLEPTSDFDAREMSMMLILVVLLLGMGLHPQPLLDLAQQTLDHFPLGGRT